MTDLPLIGSPLDFLRGADGLTAHFVALFFTAAVLYRCRSRIPLRLDLAALALGRWSSRWEHPRSGPCC